MPHSSARLAFVLILWCNTFSWAGEYHLIASEMMVHGIKVGTPVELLGQEIGQVEELSYSNDGRLIDVRLQVKDGQATKVVNSLYAIVAAGKNGSIIELHRRADPLGVQVVEVSEGLLIKKVFSETTASRIGIEKDDILRSINSERVRTLDQWEKFTAGIEDHVKLKVRVFRNGKAGTQIGVADFSSGAKPLASGEIIPLEIPSSQRRKVVSTSDASAAVKKAADGILPQLKSTLVLAMQLGDVVFRDVDELLGKVNNAMDDELAELLAKMDSTLDSLDNTLESVTPAAESTIEDYDRIGEKLEQLVYRMDTMMGVFESEVQYLPGTMATTNRMMCQSAEMVDAVRNHWVMRRMIDRQQRRRWRR